ncbi:MAG: cytidine deaminase [Bacteroidetes bacterium]|nr:cytidine deaminase [Bacteroidota bacterium]
MKKEYQELIKAANRAKLNAYAPYSKYYVGAAVLTDDGKIFSGCNIENSSYGLTICAERTAIFNAITQGMSKFKAIAIVSNNSEVITPCGACRQVLFELAGDIDIIMSGSSKKIKIVRLKKLLPLPFTGNNLK